MDNHTRSQQPRRAHTLSLLPSHLPAGASRRVTGSIPLTLAALPALSPRLLLPGHPTAANGAFSCQALVLKSASRGARPSSSAPSLPPPPPRRRHRGSGQELHPAQAGSGQKESRVQKRVRGFGEKSVFLKTRRVEGQLHPSRSPMLTTNFSFCFPVQPPGRGAEDADAPPRPEGLRPVRGPGVGHRPRLDCWLPEAASCPLLLSSRGEN